MGGNTGLPPQASACVWEGTHSVRGSGDKGDAPAQAQADAPEHSWPAARRVEGNGARAGFIPMEPASCSPA